MARHEGNIAAGMRTALSPEEVGRLIGDGPEGEQQAREDAIACYLSGSDGWTEAVKILGGAFAEELAGLRARKDD